MKKKKNLHTSFIKFLLEKYTDETQRLPQQEPEDEVEPTRMKVRKMNELEDEEEPQEPLPDEDDEGGVDEIQELLNEYKRLKKRNENNRLYNRRRK
jgi:hypothetical protein